MYKQKEQRKTKREENDKIDNRKNLLNLCNIYLNLNENKNISESFNYELECKFGTRGFKNITKIDYLNVIKKLLSCGFQKEYLNDEKYVLKIQPETIDPKTGQFRIAYDIDVFRVEINGKNNIEKYCRTNSLTNVIENSKRLNEIKIMKKTDVFINDEKIKPINYDDFNFRITFKKEDNIKIKSKLGKSLIENWNNYKKQFRYLKRITLVNNEFRHFKIDLSIVKSSSLVNKRMIKTYNIDESNVFNNQESYEIEIEVLDNIIGNNYSAENLRNDFEKIIKIILSGLQKTNYPVSYNEQNNIIEEYLNLIEKEKEQEEQENSNEEFGEKRKKIRAFPNQFIGPSSKTLQIKNIVPLNPNINEPNITKPLSFCVTDKADGERHLLYISKNGKIYLINTNMNVIFSGAKTNNNETFNSLIDGELINYNKNNEIINTFAAFDIYYLNNKDIRHLPFMNIPIKDNKIFEKGVRLNILKNLVKLLEPKSILSKNEENIISPLTIIVKNFYPYFQPYISSSDNLEKIMKETQTNFSIFDSCSYILQKEKDGLFNYNIDGLIFTPTLLGVGSDVIGKSGPNKKTTWDYSFKWKPTEFNTIDFLVITKKGKDGQDIIKPIFENGINNLENSQYNLYKTLILAVGYNERRHGYINPCQDLLDDNFPIFKEGDEDSKKNRPVQFYPSDPYDIEAGLTNIMLKPDANNVMQMYTEEGEVFEDGTIVEFKFDNNKKGLWRWIPLRIRYDKTQEFRSGQNNFGNDYKTADSNWYSIHNPITTNMIISGQDIPNILEINEIYYNASGNEKYTESMRDFHNLFVKKMLIERTSHKGNILIDYACGKGGDFSKWINAKLDFVFGIDIVKDNLENRLNGACARYLNYKKEFKHVPYALFVNGNSSLNIRSGQAMLNDKALAITKAVFGQSEVSEKLGSAVVRQYGKGHEGFNISSIQFAIHYMFESNNSLFNFIRNVAECTKINGYFIGTSYDGKTIFNLLKKKIRGESIELYENEKKIWEIIKDYDNNDYYDDESCLGYKIQVYQDSINQLIPEYLVNFVYLNRIMENYGFVLLSNDEAKSIGFPSSIGNFQDLYNIMIKQVKENPNIEKNYGNALNMSNNEKYISFLNKYFIYKKIRTIDAEQLTRNLLNERENEIIMEKEQSIKAQEIVNEENILLKPRIKKLKKKLILVEATEALEEQKEEQKKEQKEEQKEEILILKKKTDKTKIKEKKDKTKTKKLKIV